MPREASLFLATLDRFVCTYKESICSRPCFDQTALGSGTLCWAEGLEFLFWGEVVSGGLAFLGAVIH